MVQSILGAVSGGNADTSLQPYIVGKCLQYYLIGLIIDRAAPSPCFQLACFT
jgi:hypothetical protein